MSPEKIARKASYVGSPEHKDAPSFAGMPKPYATASICDRSFLGKQVQMTRWLRKAIRKKCFGPPWEGNFPRYIWYKDGNTVYEARLVNRGCGEYKGYPLKRSEWPDRINRYYD